MHKYGREFAAAVMENRDGCVSERVRIRVIPISSIVQCISALQVMKKLTINTPSADLVEGYLTEIARGFGLQWNSDPRTVGDGQHSDVQTLVVSDLALLRLCPF